MDSIKSKEKEVKKMKNNNRFLSVLTIGLAVSFAAVSSAFVLTGTQGTSALPAVLAPCPPDPVTLSSIPCEDVTNLAIENNFTQLPEFSWNGFVGTDVVSATGG